MSILSQLYSNKRAAKQVNLAHESLVGLDATYQTHPKSTNYLILVGKCKLQPSTSSSSVPCPHLISQMQKGKKSQIGRSHHSPLQAFQTGENNRPGLGSIGQSNAPGTSTKKGDRNSKKSTRCKPTTQCSPGGTFRKTTKRARPFPS